MGMSRIKGTAVVLHVRTPTGERDAGNRPVYMDDTVIVENVLIGAPSTEDIENEVNLSGRRIVYTLGIPKGDTHDWTNTTVEFWGQRFRTVGVPAQGIEENIPLDWNKKVQVTAYE